MSDDATGSPEVDSLPPFTSSLCIHHSTTVLRVNRVTTIAYHPIRRPNGLPTSTQWHRPGHYASRLVFFSIFSSKSTIRLIFQYHVITSRSPIQITMAKKIDIITMNPLPFSIYPQSTISVNKNKRSNYPWNPT